MSDKDCLLSYLAGAIDCDGYLTIKRSTYAMRVRGDASNPVYSERVGLKQVTPEIPTLLHSLFGGRLAVEKPSARRGKPLHNWQTTDRQAYLCVSALRPFLKVKTRQADILLALRAAKHQPRTGDENPVAIPNRWGTTSILNRRKVGKEQIAERQSLFEQIKALNDGRSTQPKLG